MAVRTVRTPEPWETSGTAPLVTIRAGGPFDGTVTIRAIPGGHGRSLVEAHWREPSGGRSDQSLESASYRIARAIAHGAAREFALGRRPTLSRS